MHPSTIYSHYFPTGSIWIFAYGSLIWRPGFDYSERIKAHLPGWSRRFWQASTDHRGVPGAPGRVVTLVPESSATCTGIAYRLDSDVEATLAYLDHREQGGYIRHYVALDLYDYSEQSIQALVYIADENDCHFVGPEPDDTVTATIATAVGPSGSNREYCLQLADALRRENIHDHHVEGIASKVGR